MTVRVFRACPMARSFSATLSSIIRGPILLRFLRSAEPLGIERKWHSSFRKVYKTLPILPGTSLGWFYDELPGFRERQIQPCGAVPRRFAFGPDSVGGRHLGFMARANTVRIAYLDEQNASCGDLWTRMGGRFLNNLQEYLAGTFATGCQQLPSGEFVPAERE